jgi:hypothetical protein
MVGGSVILCGAEAYYVAVPDVPSG